jgi:hypothetical protein
MAEEEEGRVQAETGRVKAETGRVEAEHGRVASERTRERRRHGGWVWPPLGMSLVLIFLAVLAAISVVFIVVQTTPPRLRVSPRD